MKETDSSETRRILINRLKHLFSYVMVCVYLGSGLYLLLKGWYTLSSTQNTGIGILLIVYAFFRIYRIIIESRIKNTTNV